MKLREFEDLVDRLGEDLSMWPEPARAAGEALLKSSAAARDILDEARLLRRALAPDSKVKASADLVDRIVFQAEQTDLAWPSAAAISQSFRPKFAIPASFRPLLLLPLCFAIGLILGLFPFRGDGSTVQIETPTFFQGCCGVWGSGQNE